MIEIFRRELKIPSTVYEGNQQYEFIQRDNMPFMEI